MSNAAQLYHVLDRLNIIASVDAVLTATIKVEETRVFPEGEGELLDFGRFTTYLRWRDGIGVTHLGGYVLP